MGLSRFAALWNYKTFTPFTVTTTPVKYTNWQNAQSGPGCVATTSADSITVQVPGTYVGLLSVSFMGTTGVTYFFEMLDIG